MTEQPKNIELSSNHKQPLLQKGQHGEYKYSAQQLSEIVNLDNNGKIPGTQTVSSSRMIVEDFGGAEAIASSLFSNTQTGIEGSPADLQDRHAFYGKNSFPPPKIKTLTELVLENFDDPINQILLGAAVVSVIIGLIQHGWPEGMIEGTSIMIALVIITFVNSANNYASERKLADLVAIADKQDVAVYRNSTETTTIDSSLLVVGDLIYFEKGMNMPADCIMVEGQDVSCIEGELTGEPHDIEKVPVTEANYQTGTISTLLAKSQVATGFGKALVMAVGPNSVAGVITEKTQVAAEPTLLQLKLETMANKIGNLGIAVAVLTLVAMCVRLALEMFEYMPCGCANVLTCEEDPKCVPLSFGERRLWNEVLNTVIIAITVIVVAIPEGLPLAVTISLSFSSAKMRKMNNLVRKLASSETMGGATHICSDKTGTLTLNKMTVMSYMTMENAHVSQESVGNTLAKACKASTQEVSVNYSTVWDLLAEGVLWNSSARIEKNNGANKLITDEYVLNGNVTEMGLIKFFTGAIGFEACISERQRLTADNTLCVISFSSSRKRASIVVRNLDKEGTDEEVRVYCKGAPDMLFDYTSRAIAQDGSIVGLGDPADIPASLLGTGDERIEAAEATHRNLFERGVKKFADQALRTLLITYKDMSMAEYEQIKADNNDFSKESDREVLENDLIAIGIFGLIDPLRPTIKDSIAKCKTAGIQVIMCTGDNLDTAIAISKNAGIVTDEQCSHHFACMTGKVFRETVGGLIQIPDPDGNMVEVDDPENPGQKKRVNKMVDRVKDMGKFRKVYAHLRVLARSSPEDKYLLVTGIQLLNGVVAVTGDGTNDAPALTKADVGFSMGITGTDIAKGASDIILLDDNFSSIIVALRYGRNVFDNVRKFLQFQLTINVVALFIVFMGSVVLKDSPLNAVQMLWVNLIMDTFAALALATEPPAHDVLKRQPYNKHAAIVTPVMWRNVFGHAIYQILALVLVIFYSEDIFGIKDYSRSCITFNSDGETCKEWNPFYTNALYEDEASQKWWQDKELSQSSFNEDLLKDFVCEKYIQKNNLSFKKQKELNCDTVFADASNIILPGDLDLEIVSETMTQKLLHFTFVFQIFVFMQLFNQINARKIEEGELNVFSGFFSNCMFVSITIVTVLVQVLMVQIGGKAVKCYPLTPDQNLTCLIFGAIELIWALIIKFTPLKLYQCISLDEKPHEEGTTSLASSFKKSSMMKKKVDSDKLKQQVNEDLKSRFASQMRRNLVAQHKDAQE